MKKQFITYEIALKLKELGFDEECFGIYIQDKDCNYVFDYYSVRIGKPFGDINFLLSKKFNPFHNDIDYPKSYFDQTYMILSPLWQQVIDWFREKHKIHISFPNHYDGWSLDIRDHSNDSSFYSLPNRWYDDYNEARIDAITYAIALYEGQKKNNVKPKFRCSSFDEDCNDVKSHQSCYDGNSICEKADGYCPFLLNTHKN